MRVIADTNVLLRITLRDDQAQAIAAQQALQAATLIAIPLTTLCEFAWVLSQRYQQTRAQVELAMKTLLSIETVAIDNAAVAAGLAMLANGGDFADGVIAFEGRRLGGATYLTFDKKAASLIAGSGGQSMLLAAKA